MDVDKTFSTFMVNDMLDATRFFQVAGGLIEAAAKAARQPHHGAVLCGEGTSVLWAGGKADAAIRVEQLWNEVGKHSWGWISFCGYALSNFHGEEDEHVFQSICVEHSAFILSERVRLNSRLTSRGVSLCKLAQFFFRNGKFPRCHNPSRQQPQEIAHTTGLSMLFSPEKDGCRSPR